MNFGQTVFSQLFEHLPHKEFQKCVARYRGDHYLKSFSCWDQFLAMSFAQLTYRESLGDIEACHAPCRASCITWASAVRCPARLSPVPTSCATGESMLTSRRFSSVSRAPCMPTIP